MNVQMLGPPLAPFCGATFTTSPTTYRLPARRGSGLGKSVSVLKFRSGPLHVIMTRLQVSVTCNSNSYQPGSLHVHRWPLRGLQGEVGDRAFKLRLGSMSEYGR